MRKQKCGTPISEELGSAGGKEGKPSNPNLKFQNVGRNTLTSSTNKRRTWNIGRARSLPEMKGIGRSKSTRLPKSADSVLSAAATVSLKKAADRQKQQQQKQQQHHHQQRRRKTSLSMRTLGLKKQLADFLSPRTARGRWKRTGAPSEYADHPFWQCTEGATLLLKRLSILNANFDELTFEESIRPMILSVFKERGERHRYRCVVENASYEKLVDIDDAPYEDALAMVDEFVADSPKDVHVRHERVDMTPVGPLIAESTSRNNPTIDYRSVQRSWRARHAISETGSASVSPPDHIELLHAELQPQPHPLECMRKGGVYQTDIDAATKHALMDCFLQATAEDFAELPGVHDNHNSGSKPVESADALKRGILECMLSASNTTTSSLSEHSCSDDLEASNDSIIALKGNDVVDAR